MPNLSRRALPSVVREFAVEQSKETAELHTIIRSLRQQIDEQDNLIDSRVVEVSSPYIGKPNKVVTLRTLIEDSEHELSWERCTVCRSLECRSRENHE